MSAWERWLRYEWQLFSCVTFSLIDVFKVGSLISINALLLFSTATSTVPESDPHHAGFEEPNLYRQSLSHRAAQLAVTNIAFSVLLSAKLSVIQRYFFEINETIRWHAWFGRIAFFQVLYHASYQIQTNYTNQDRSIVAALTSNVRHTTGALMLSALFLLLFGSHSLVRLISYRLFRITHLAALAVLICSGCFHHWSFYVFYVMVLVFWVMDQIDRSYRTDMLVAEALPGDIALARPVDRHYFTFYVKATGNRTKPLYDIAQSGSNMIKVRISKPLGRPYVTSAGAEYGDFDSVILVAEGMGITPWISVLQYIEQKQHAIKTKSVNLIWSIHSIDTFYAFEQELERFSDALQLDLSIKIYVTGLSDPEENYSIPNNLTYIKFKASGRPNYTALLQELDQQGNTTAVGVCAHESTLVKLNNLCLSHSWAIRKERFEL
ncbi:hypothetical protein FB192DRAFT_1337238 [Mucor lusitanicus]|uniref:FAD-binding FR-type domain-containing protein n=1 Tax=Mucor circinelloides f. lusitanicus TaxID=29924 RepID=A0A8H4B5U0_MUCCL|nr:hypothetical protein FB192DRAFT_1337238 [Mucor lusitanicus]